MVEVIVSQSSYKSVPPIRVYLPLNYITVLTRGNEIMLALVLGVFNAEDFFVVSVELSNNFSGQNIKDLFLTEPRMNLHRQKSVSPLMDKE